MKMTIDKFNYRYKEKGGFGKLHEMVVDLNCSQKDISKYFGASKTSVKFWIVDLFGGIDTRHERRDRRINNILEFMKTHNEYESSQAFKHENSEYYTEALFLAYKEGIYSNQANSCQTTQTT
jgi:predicted transcriptional regulator